MKQAAIAPDAFAEVEVSISCKLLPSSFETKHMRALHTTALAGPQAPYVFQSMFVLKCHHCRVPLPLWLSGRLSSATIAKLIGEEGARYSFRQGSNMSRAWMACSRSNAPLGTTHAMGAWRVLIETASGLLFSSPDPED